MNASIFRIKFAYFLLPVLFPAFTFCEKLPNVSKIEKLAVDYYEIGDELRQKLDKIFLQKEIKDYLLCQKINFDYEDNNEVQALLTDHSFTILSMGENERLGKNIVCSHENLPNHIIKFYRPLANAVYSHDDSLVQRILYRGEIDIIINKLGLTNIHVPEKNTYIFPWAKQVDEGIRTKPYLVIVQKIEGTKFVAQLSDEEIQDIFTLAIEAEYVDICIFNFVVNEEGIWIVDTERHTLKDFKSSFNSIEDAQVYYMQQFKNKINKFRPVLGKHPLDTQCSHENLEASRLRHQTCRPYLECCS